jgi:hypothetical protein
MDRIWSTFGLIILAAFAAQAGDDAKDKPATKSPVTAKLVAKKTTFDLDLAGMTAEQYKKALANELTSCRPCRRWKWPWS